MIEFIKMSHIDVTYSETSRSDITGSRNSSLEDFNLQLLHGEITFLIGLYGSGKRTVKEVLKGNIEGFNGILYIDGIPCIGYNRSWAVKKGIITIDTNKSLVETLSVAENIFSIRRHKMFGLIFQRKVIYDQTKRLLSQVYMECNPSSPVYQLTEFQKQLLCIAKAISSGVSLLIIDCIYASFSEPDLIILKKIIIDLKRKGISCLIISDKPNELLRISDKAVIMKDGTDVKILENEEIQNKEVISYLLDGKLPYPLSNVPRAHILGIYDVFDALNEMLWSDSNYQGIINILRKLPDGFFKKEELDSLDEWFKTQQAVFIPENSYELLMWNMPLEDNLAVRDYKKLSDAGVINKGMLEYRKKEFYRRFNLDGSEEIEDLAHVYKKIITIFRWEFKKPKLLVLGNPIVNIDILSSDVFKKYIFSLQEQGIRIVIISKSVFSIKQLCSQTYYLYQEELKMFKDKIDILELSATQTE